MPIIMKHKKRGSVKRHTWPRTQVDQLETIPESPRTPTKSQQATDSESPTRKAKGQAREMQSIDQKSVKIAERTSSLRGTQAQMVWYNHHLTESQRERERLWNRLEELEGVCKSQSKANGKLLQDVSSWQKACEEMEIELADATQAIKEAKSYIRDIEMANSNLVCAVNQVREEQERERQRRWRNRLQRCFKRCMQLPKVLCGTGKSEARAQDFEIRENRQEGSEPATPPSRPSGRKPPQLSSRPPSRMSGSFTSDQSSASTLNSFVNDEID